MGSKEEPFEPTSVRLTAGIREEGWAGGRRLPEAASLHTYRGDV